jgi:hypothetical protein
MFIRCTPAIESFKGAHMIHVVGTYQFLYKWLRWPRH